MSEITKEKLCKIRKFNVFMGVLHLIQGLLMLTAALTIDLVRNFTPAVFTNFLKFDEIAGTLVTNTNLLFELPFAVFVSVFLLLSSMAHFIIASPRFNNVYNNGLKKGINHFRWYEYSISSSIMIVLIALLFGINDLGALILIFGLNMTMNLLGLLMEKHNQTTDKTDWTSFIVGSVAGIIPWIVVTMFAFGNSDLSMVPWFVYAIFASYFLFFNLFPINMVLQYMKVGKWKDYLYGEKIYIVLSLVSKSILAWIVFAGIMQP